MKNIILELDGKSLSYYVGGDPEKPTVICFHGLAGSSLYSFTQLAISIKGALSPYFNRPTRAWEELTLWEGEGLYIL
jgi:pimeloyl-ACP methyl ester carboxylesterase